MRLTAGRDGPRNAFVPSKAEFPLYPLDVMYSNMGHLSAWMRSAGTSTSVTPRKENKSFTRYLGGCFRSLFHNVTSSVGDRSPEHYTLGLEASEVHAYDLARLEHRSCTKILPPREVKCKPFAMD